MQDADLEFLTGIVHRCCEQRKECDASDPCGKRCENYYLCYPLEASWFVKRLQRKKIARFNRAIQKLENASDFVGDWLDELHKVF